MIFPLFVASSDEEDRDIERRKPGHATRKEILRLAVVIFGLTFGTFALFYPGCKAQRDVVVSKERLKAIHAAMLLYAEDNSDGLPTLFEPSPHDRSRPALFGGGVPFTWANKVFEYSVTKDVNSLRNPSCPADAESFAYSQSGPPLRVGYGLVAEYGGERMYNVADPDDKVLIAETFSSGYGNSPNPHPIPGVRDGFVIGYSDGNLRPTQFSEYVTRLAYTRLTEDEMTQGVAVHGQYGILAISAGGGLITLTPSNARIARQGKLPYGRWVPFR